MKEIKKIVVSIDGSVYSSKAVERAIELAQKGQAHLCFLYVSAHVHKAIPSDLIFGSIWEQLPKDISASRHEDTGTVYEAIIRLATKENADLIIMGSRGLGLFRGALIGSQSQKVIEHSNIPVMVVK